ncbi:EAL domain-containing protein [Pontibacillus salicampi]|uniref:EAL domain-containing protein n=1 Tax=Pontibacillus salicampi TaxID=1449801 RepID=A0ABV6LIY6_9BACI
MEPCKHCGTFAPIPATGYILVDTSECKWKNADKIETTNKTMLKFPFHSREDLIHMLDIWKENESFHQTVQILNEYNTPSLPIRLQHLWERLKYPLFTEIIQESAFTSYLQPIVNLQKESIFGYEALLRTDNKNVSPAELFSFAQRAGLHSMLDQKAREEAVKKKAAYIPAGQKCFINFLPSTIYVPEYCLQHTFHIINQYHVDPADLVFEVVETEEITNIKHLKNILEVYQQSGMHVALDDVGSGYSTLDVLQLLTPDIVKIDRDYIRNCHESEQNQAFLKQIIQTTKQLDLLLLAEGIETREEYEWLQQAGIDYGQGYYIGKPSPKPVHKFIHS